MITHLLSQRFDGPMEPCGVGPVADSSRKPCQTIQVRHAKPLRADFLDDPKSLTDDRSRAFAPFQTDRCPCEVHKVDCHAAAIAPLRA